MKTFGAVLLLLFSATTLLPSNTTARLFYSKGFNETALALNNYGEVDVKWKYDMLFGAATAMCPEGHVAERCVSESSTSLSVSIFGTKCWEDVKTILQTCNMPDDELEAYHEFYSKVVKSGDGTVKIREYLKWLFTKAVKTGKVPNDEQCDCFIDRLMHNIKSSMSESVRIGPIMAIASEVQSIFHSISTEAATS